MKKTLFMVMLWTLGMFEIFSQINSSSPARPFNSNTGYAYGIMPTNLPSGGTYGKSQDAADAYNSWKTKFVQSCSNGSRVLYDDNSSTVSEGIAYGMLLAAYAGDKPLLDDLWKYYKANSNGNGVMNWKMSGCTGTSGSNGATDAELDAAMALIIAEEQWPSASAPYDYKAEAATLISKIRQYEIHPSTYQTINGDAWGFGNSCRNPSYFSPAYYREFAKIETSQASFWNSTVSASNSFLLTNRNSTTGLVSNWADNNAAANSCNGPLEFGWDACRNPWRMATDVLWNGPTTATVASDICTKTAAWSNGYGSNMRGPLPQNAANPSVGTYANSAFVGPWAVGVMGSSSTYQSHLNTCYTNIKSITGEAYFPATLRAISLFVLSGNFWKPGGTVVTNQNPTVSLISPTSGASICSGATLTLTATASDPDGSISKVEFYNGTTLITTVTSSPYTYSWTSAPTGSLSITAKAYDNTTGTASSSAVSVTVNAAPSAPTVNTPIAYCVGATATALSATGTALKWYTVSTAGTSSSTAPIPTTTVAGAQNYWVSQTVNGCESPRSQIVVNVNQTAAPTVSSPVNYCQGATAVALTATGTSLKWYTVATSGTGSSTAPTPTTTATGTQNYWVSQTLNGCEGSRAQIVVNIGTATAAPSVTSPVNYCQGATAVALTATGSNLLWYTTQTTGTGSTVAPIPSTISVGNTIYYVSQTSSGCESARSSITVSIVASPSAPGVVSPVVYNVGDVATQLTASGNSLKWYTVASGGTSSTVAPTPNTSVTGTVTYYVSQTNSSNCESPRASIVVTVSNLYKVYKVNTAPVIDGVIDAIWNNSSTVAAPVAKTITGAISGTSDLSGTFKVVWDNTYLYVLADVNDDTKMNDSPDAYNDDAPEIYIDINNDKATSYGSNDVQYTLGWNDGAVIGVNPSGRSSANITYSISSKTAGYVLEARIPWSTLQGSPVVGQLVGFDFMINDDDDGSDRDGKLSWNATTDDAWQNPSLFGTMILSDVVTSLNEQLFSNLQVFPNPVQNYIEVQGLVDGFEYDIVDHTGKVVIKGSSERVIEVHGLSTGVYGLLVKTDGFQKVVKIIKQ